MDEKADYGMDAPNVMKGLTFGFFGSLAVLPFAFLIESPTFRWILFFCPLISALFCGGIALGMRYSSRILKPKIIRDLFDRLEIQGTETILDLGCGRGLLLIEGAKRVHRGKSVGVDIWQSKDQSGNKIDATLENARIEKVEDRIQIETADLRSLPFESNTFDIVVSNLVIHNIPSERGREEAFSEMIRVLKPGGKFGIIDIHYGKKYIQYLRKQERIRVTETKQVLYYFPPLWIIEGRKQYTQLNSKIGP